MTERTLSLNGRLLQTEAATLQALLREQGFPADGAIACAVNLQFVPRGQWAAHALQAQDQIDVIVPVTGG